MTPVSAVRLMFIFLGALLLVVAVTVAVVPLPAPAAGGTCGPGNGSEPAVVAFFDPVTIGAGSEASAASTGDLSQWQAFVSECQSATDTRMISAGSLFVAALLVWFGTPWAVRRFVTERVPVQTQAAGSAPPGWYSDPADPGAVRWWDGRAWGTAYARPSQP